MFKLPGGTEIETNVKELLFLKETLKNRNMPFGPSFHHDFGKFTKNFINENGRSLGWDFEDLKSKKNIDTFYKIKPTLAKKMKYSFDDQLGLNLVTKEEIDTIEYYVIGIRFEYIQIAKNEWFRRQLEDIKKLEE